MTNIVTTQQAQQSATTWFKAIMKQHSVRASVEDRPYGVVMTKTFGTAAMSGEAMRKMERMFNTMRTGFNKSKEWHRDDSAPFYMDRFFSEDGRFKVVLVKQYNGSGGYKVATMYFMFKVVDLRAEEANAPITA